MAVTALLRARLVWPAVCLFGSAFFFEGRFSRVKRNKCRWFFDGCCILLLIIYLACFFCVCVCVSTPDSQDALLTALEGWGFEVAQPRLRPTPSAEKLVEFHREVARDRASLGYAVDGVVYKLDDLALQVRHGPRFCFWLRVLDRPRLVARRLPGGGQFSE